MADLARVKQHYLDEQRQLPDLIKSLELSGCPREHSSYRYRMLRDYNLPPFEGAVSDYPAWWEDDMLYFDIQRRYSELPYEIAKINEYIANVNK